MTEKGVGSRGEGDEEDGGVSSILLGFWGKGKRDA
jgi:hypothetical protein